MLPTMKPLRDDLPTMKHLPGVGPDTLKRSHMKPMSGKGKDKGRGGMGMSKGQGQGLGRGEAGTGGERERGRGKDDVFHETGEIKEIKELPCRVEVVIPDDVPVEEEPVLEPIVDLDFKLPSSYGKGERETGKKARLGAGKSGSPACRHCGAEVKRGWWLCPVCKKKL